MSSRAPSNPASKAVHQFAESLTAKSYALLVAPGDTTTVAASTVRATDGTSSDEPSRRASFASLGASQREFVSAQQRPTSALDALRLISGESSAKSKVVGATLFAHRDALAALLEALHKAMEDERLAAVQRQQKSIAKKSPHAVVGSLHRQASIASAVSSVSATSILAASPSQPSLSEGGGPKAGASTALAPAGEAESAAANGAKVFTVADAQVVVRRLLATFPQYENSLSRGAASPVVGGGAVSAPSFSVATEIASDQKWTVPGEPSSSPPVITDTVSDCSPIRQRGPRDASTVGPAAPLRDARPTPLAPIPVPSDGKHLNPRQCIHVVSEFVFDFLSAIPIAGSKRSASRIVGSLKKDPTAADAMGDAQAVAQLLERVDGAMQRVLSKWSAARDAAVAARGATTPTDTNVATLRAAGSFSGNSSFRGSADPFVAWLEAYETNVSMETLNSVYGVIDSIADDVTDQSLSHSPSRRSAPLTVDGVHQRLDRIQSRRDRAVRGLIRQYTVERTTAAPLGSAVGATTSTGASIRDKLLNSNSFRRRRVVDRVMQIARAADDEEWKACRRFVRQVDPISPHGPRYTAAAGVASSVPMGGSNVSGWDDDELGECTAPVWSGRDDSRILPDQQQLSAVSIVFDGAAMTPQQQRSSPLRRAELSTPNASRLTDGAEEKTARSPRAVARVPSPIVMPRSRAAVSGKRRFPNVHSRLHVVPEILDTLRDAIGQANAAQWRSYGSHFPITYASPESASSRRVRSSVAIAVMADALRETRWPASVGGKWAAQKPSPW